MRYAFWQALFLAFFVSGFSTGQPAPAPSRASAERLKTGRFQYRTLINGKEEGTNGISITKSSADMFIFTNRVSGAFAQRWETVATATFVPISAKISFGEVDKLQPRFELNYRDGRAIGWRLDKSTNKIDIDVQPLP